MDWLRIAASAQSLKEGVSLLISSKSKQMASADQKIIQTGEELEQALGQFLDALKEKTE